MNKLVLKIEEINRNENRVSLKGFVFDYKTKTVPELKILHGDGSKISNLQWTYRGEVNSTFSIPVNIECGFTIDLKINLETKKILLLFFNKNSKRKITLKLKKRVCHWKERKDMISSVLNFVEKSILYMYRNGPIQTLKKINNKFRSNNKRYEKWIAKNEKCGINADNKDNLLYKPLISIILPVYNVDIKYLKSCIDSIKEQSYSNWELCIADDCSSNHEIKPFLIKTAQTDERIKLVFREKNGHISKASNSALALANGEYIGLIDNDDLLAKNALFEVVKVLNQDKTIDLLYSDEDKINRKSKRSNPYFKSDWAPDSFLSGNYICHFTVIRRTLVERLGGFRVGFEGAQDYDLVLRVTEVSSKIYHIPKILYHWRMLESSTAMQATSKNYAFDAGKIAIEEALVRRNLKGKVSFGCFPGIYDIKYDIDKKECVSIIIPTRDHKQDLEKCISSIMKKTDYDNFEIIIANNGSIEKTTIEFLKRIEIEYGGLIKVINIDIPFNFSRINNIAAKKAKGHYLLFLNNDTEVINKMWLTNMVRFAQFERVGAVGAKLYYPDGTIQHAGVVMGIGGAAGHIHYNFPKNDYGYYGKLVTNTNYLCVTGACLMVKTEDFIRAGGFDENFEVAFNDIDLCLKLFELNKDNVWVHDAELYHFESKSRGYEDSPEKKVRFTNEINLLREKWLKYMINDPFYNINLSKNRSDFTPEVD